MVMPSRYCSPCLVPLSSKKPTWKAALPPADPWAAMSGVSVNAPWGSRTRSHTRRWSRWSSHRRSRRSATAHRHADHDGNDDHQRRSAPSSDRAHDSPPRRRQLGLSVAFRCLCAGDRTWLIVCFISQSDDTEFTRLRQDTPEWFASLLQFQGANRGEYPTMDMEAPFLGWPRGAERPAARSL